MNFKIENLTEKLEQYKNKVERDKLSKKWEPVDVAFYEGLIEGLEAAITIVQDEEYYSETESFLDDD